MLIANGMSGDSNAHLAMCYRCAPLVLNANTLARCYFLISSALTCKHAGRMI